MADCTHLRTDRKRPHEAPDAKHSAGALTALNFGLLRDLQGVIYFDAKVSDGAFEPIASRQ